jgi:hypothetical protein
MRYHPHTRPEYLIWRKYVTHCYKVRFILLKLISEKTHVLKEVTQGHYVTTVIVKLAHKAASHPINLNLQLLSSDSLKYRMIKTNLIKMLSCGSPLLTFYFFFVWVFKKLLLHRWRASQYLQFTPWRNALAVTVPLSNISLYLRFKMVV